MKGTFPEYVACHIQGLLYDAHYEKYKSSVHSKHAEYLHNVHNIHTAYYRITSGNIKILNINIVISYISLKVSVGERRGGGGVWYQNMSTTLCP